MYLINYLTKLLFYPLGVTIDFDVRMRPNILIDRNSCINSLNG